MLNSRAATSTLAPSPHHCQAAVLLTGLTPAVDKRSISQLSLPVEDSTSNSSIAASAEHHHRLCRSMLGCCLHKRPSSTSAKGCD